MAKVILEAGDNYIAASAAVKVIFGSTGSETVKIQDGVAVTTDASVERIEFTRASSDYSYKATSTGVQVSYNGTPVANLATGGKVAFTNGSASIASSFDATTGTATFTLGGKVVPTTATTGTVLAPTISNATGEASTLTPSTATSSSTYSIAAAAGSVTEGGAVSFTVTASSASATATTLSYQISGVAVGASVNAASTADFSSVTGTVTIPANATTATFSVVPTNDGVVEGFEGFKVSLLDSSFNTVATSGSVVIADGASSGQTFTLTTGADTTLVGGAGDDTFVGVLASGGTNTLNSGDVLNGGAGTDTLNISISGTNTGAVTTSAVTLTGVENISVNNYGTAGTPNDNTINLAQASGVTNISLSSSATSGDTKFEVVRNIVTAGMGNGAGDLSIQYTDAAVVGTADVQTLNLTGQTAGTFTVTAATTGGIESLAISSKTVANTIAVVSSTLTGITITGDQNLTLTEGTTNTLTSVDASALTGKLVFTTDDVTAINVVGGSADDKVTLGTTFTSADSINGGTGNDTLSIGTAIGASTDLVNVTNIETLAITGNNNVTLATNVSPTIFDLSAAGTTNVLTLSSGYTNATTVKISSGDTVNNSGAKVNLTVNLAGAALNTNTTITGGTGTTAGTDTLNLTADSTASAGTDFANITNVESIVIVDGGDDALAGLKPAGQDVNLNLGSYAQTLIIDASALDAASIDNNADGKINDSDISAEVLTVTGGSAATLNITGGAAADQITAGAQNDTINGGGGNDTINTGDGNNSVLGGAGSDTITAGTGNDYIDGGADNDKFILAGNLTVGDTIIGGDGNDTLVVNSVTSAALANVSGVENLQFSGDVSLSSNISFSSFNLADATAGQALTLASGYTNATTVSLGEGDATTGDKVDNTGANATLTVNAYGAAFVDAGGSDTSATVFGGTGTDTVNLTADSSNVSFAGLITGVDVVNIIDGGDDAATGTKPAGQDITLTLSSYATALTIDGSALDAATVDTNADSNLDDEAAAEVLTVSGSSVLAKLKVTGGAAADNITTGSGAYNDTVDGGAGNDSINSGAGNDSILGGDGNDIITFAGNLTGDDTVNGGAGSNTLIVSSAGDLNFLNVSNIQTLEASATATYTLDTRAQAAGITTISDAGGAIYATIDAAGFTNGLTFKTTNGNDSLVSGTGNDTFVFAGTGNLNENDTIKAGAGTDTIRLDNAASATAAGTAVSVTIGTVTGVENILVNDLSNVANDVTGDVSITFNSVYAQNNITIDGSALDAGETLTVDASANIADNTSTTAVNEAEAVSVIGGAGDDIIQGGTANDVISGGAGADSLTGNAGNDTINGGDGADTITGGAGLDNITTGSNSDLIVYSAVSDSTGVNSDVITDFTSGTDKLAFTIDASGASASTNINVSSFASVSGFNDGLISLAGTSTSIGEIRGDGFYNTAEGKLYIDANGDGQINQNNDYTVTVSTVASSDLVFKLIGGAGTDVIVGGTGDDTITGGAGVDTITSGGGNDIITDYGTGSAADVLKFAAAVGTASPASGTGRSGQTYSNNTDNLVTFLADTEINADAAWALAEKKAAVQANTTLSAANKVSIFTDASDAYVFYTGATIATSDDQFMKIEGGSNYKKITLQTIDAVAGAGFILEQAGLTLTTTSLANYAGSDAEAAWHGVDATHSFFGINHGSLAGYNTVTIDLTSSPLSGIDNAIDGGTFTLLRVSVGNATAPQWSGTGAARTVTGAATNDLIFGGSAADSIDGAAGNDLILGGNGDDTLTGDAGIDIISGGAGDDVIKTTGALFVGSNAVIDTIDGGAGTDSLLLTDTATAVTIASTDILTRIQNVEKITTVANSAAISITIDATNQVASTGSDFTTIDLSGDTDATGTNVISSTGADGITTIIGSAGVDQITLGASAPATTITGGTGADTLSISTTNAVSVSDTDGIAITVSGSTASNITTTGPLLATSITGGTGVDTITLAGGVSNVATITGGTGADALNFGAPHTGGVHAVYLTSNATADADTITNFISGTDKLVALGAANALTATVAGSAFVTTSTTANYGGSASADVPDGSIISYTNGSGTALTASTIAALFATTATASKFLDAGASSHYLFVDIEPSSTVVWTIQNTATAGVASSEITQVVTLTGVTSVAFGDFSAT